MDQGLLQYFSSKILTPDHTLQYFSCKILTPDFNHHHYYHHHHPHHHHHHHHQCHHHFKGGGGWDFQTLAMKEPGSGLIPIRSQSSASSALSSSIAWFVSPITIITIMISWPSSQGVTFIIRRCLRHFGVQAVQVIKWETIWIVQSHCLRFEPLIITSSKVFFIKNEK